MVRERVRALQQVREQAQERQMQAQRPCWPHRDQATSWAAAH